MRNRRISAPATLALLVTLALLGAACTAHVRESTPSTSTSTTTSSVPSILPETNLKVDTDLEDAVAPFDHDSAVLWQRTEAELARPSPEYVQYLNACLSADGFDPIPPLPEDLPDADNVVWVSNWQFPRIDALRAGGFPSFEVDESMLTDAEEGTPDPARDEALGSCIESAAEKFAGSAHRLAADTFAYLRGEWERTLTIIDESEAVGEELARFQQCLIEADIPSEWVGSTMRFLEYVDEKLWQADDDEQVVAAIRLELGQLYAECSEAMFALKLDRRSGTAREEFLERHAPTLRALSQLIEGEIPPNYSVPTSPVTA